MIVLVIFVRYTIKYVKTLDLLNTKLLMLLKKEKINKTKKMKNKNRKKKGQLLNFQSKFNQFPKFEAFYFSSLKIINVSNQLFGSMAVIIFFLIFFIIQ